MRQADALAKVIAYVRVPADTSQPLQELSFQSYDGIAGDGLLDHLRPLFTKKENERVDTQLLKEHSVSTLAGSVDLPSISDSTLQSVASEANVETFSLVHPIASNNFQGINIYLDEGTINKLLFFLFRFALVSNTMLLGSWFTSSYLSQSAC